MLIAKNSVFETNIFWLIITLFYDKKRLPSLNKGGPWLNDELAERDLLRGGEASLVLEGGDRPAEQEVELVAGLTRWPARRSFVRIPNWKFVSEKYWLNFE